MVIDITCNVNVHCTITYQYSVAALTNNLEELLNISITRLTNNILEQKKVNQMISVREKNSRIPYYKANY